MVASRATLPDLDALNPQELKALIVAQHKQLTTQEERILTQSEQLASRDAEIEHLKLLIAKLRRMQFRRSSEKLDRSSEKQPQRKGRWRVRRAGHCLSIYRVKCKRTSRKKKLARTVAGSYNAWVKMHRKSWSTCARESR